MNKVYQIVTETILALLDTGVSPFKQTWENVRTNGVPFNLKSKKPYRGSNLFLLGMQGAPSNAWVTFKQAQDLGGNVKKGAKSTIVVFWQFLEKEQADGSTKKVPMLRFYRVFNAIRDCEGLEDHVRKFEADLPEFGESKPVSILSDYIARAGIAFSHGGNSACYIPSKDAIQMPHEGQFDTSDCYNHVLAHECIHSTGHKSRLNRDGFEGGSVRFGDAVYSFEELIAELGACMVSASCGIDPDFNNSASYIEGWSKSLRDNPDWFVRASGKAQKATDLILNEGADHAE